MDEEVLSTASLIEQCENNAYKRLADPNLSEAKRVEAVKEAETLSKIRRTDAIVAQQCINANFKNENDSLKVRIAEQRVALDKARLRVDCVKAGLYTFAGFGAGLSSYFLDEWFSKNQTLHKLKDKFIEMIIKK